MSAFQRSGAGLSSPESHRRIVRSETPRATATRLTLRSFAVGPRAAACLANHARTWRRRGDGTRGCRGLPFGQ
jgi:hypothetical protein